MPVVFCGMHSFSNHVASPWSAVFAALLLSRCGIARVQALRAAEFRLAFIVERLDTLAEIVGLAEPAIAMAFEFDRGLEIGVFGLVEQCLCRALRQRREGAQFVDQGIGRRLELVVRDAFGGDAPVISLLGRNAL